MRCNDGCACLQMGGAASKPADIASLASSAVDYQPPLGPPNPVSLLLPVIRWLCKDSFTAPCLSPFLWHTNAPHSYFVMRALCVQRCIGLPALSVVRLSYPAEESTNVRGP